MWVRKGLVYFLSLLLFFSLLGTAFSTSANLALTHPNKIENWLNQSNFYNHFVSGVINNAKKSVGSSENPGSVTLSDTAVQQAAQSSFTQQMLQSDINTFLESNYSWLEGKVSKPSFVIDLTSAKQSFTDQVSLYVKDHVASLPVCTPKQLATFSGAGKIDPLNITCRPAILSPQAESTQVTQEINSSSTFLGNTVITAQNIHTQKVGQGEPYYQRFSHLPKAYQLGIKMPWIYAVTALLSSLAIVFVAARKRHGLRRVGIMLLVASLVLISLKFVADTILNSLEKHLFNQSNVGQLQQSLTYFLHLVQQQLVKVDLWFGIGYLLLAVIIFAILMITRSPKRKVVPPGTTDTQPLSASEQEAVPNTPRNVPQPQGSHRPMPPGPPPRPKRPRLIQ